MSGKAVLLALLVLPGCAPRSAAAPPNASQGQADTSAQALVLERTPCFGGCPVYTVAVSPAGKITYEGRANVRQIGAATDTIPPARLDSLLYQLASGGFFSFADRYVQSEPACGRYATDSPSAIVTLTYGGRTKKVVHDYGCAGAPGALTVLQRRIDEVLGTARWTGR